MVLPPSQRAAAEPVALPDEGAADEPVQTPVGAGEGAGDIVALLRRQVRALEGLVLEARGAAMPEVGAINMLSRTLTATVALLAKVTPPPAPDPAEHPDYVEAARVCVEKIVAAAERARAVQT